MVRNIRRNNPLGELGERLAEKFLSSKGYSTISRNYRIRGGEIDIVAKKGGIIVFVEVKTRRGTRFGEAFEAIDHRKKQKLIRTIHHYLAENGYSTWRCDLIAISMPTPGSHGEPCTGNNFPTAQIRHFKNIFLS